MFISNLNSVLIAKFFLCNIMDIDIKEIHKKNVQALKNQRHIVKKSNGSPSIIIKSNN